MMILFMQIQNSLFLSSWIIYAKRAMVAKKKKKTEKNRRECKKIFTIMHNRHYLLLLFFSLSLSLSTCPACQRPIHISFVIFSIYAKRIKRKKDFFQSWSYDDNDVDEHLTRKKKNSVLSNLLYYSLCIIDRSLFPDYNKSSSLSVGRHRNHISKKSFSFSFAFIQMKSSECGR
jgi:hypothetical protein